MKTSIKSLFLAFTISLITFSTLLAKINPIGRPAAVATYKTSIYTTLEGKITIALDKQTTGAVDIHLKTLTGKSLFFQHVTKHEKVARIRLDVSELANGIYQVEITNGVDTTIHAITIPTSQPDVPVRLVAIKAN